MQVYSLGLDDFSDEEYSLIGIHTTLEDFKLAYLLNKTLLTKFRKLKNDLTIEVQQEKVSFPMFKYENTKYDFDWFLIANSIKTENLTSTNQLLLTTETKKFLIPEKKKIDYFIKISGEIETSFITKTIKKIKSIDQIITSYSIDKNTLKSKDFLIT